jgi:hypothetical protein
MKAGHFSTQGKPLNQYRGGIGGSGNRKDPG